MQQNNIHAVRGQETHSENGIIIAQFGENPEQITNLLYLYNNCNHM